MRRLLGAMLVCLAVAACGAEEDVPGAGRAGRDTDDRGGGARSRTCWRCAAWPTERRRSRRLRCGPVVRACACAWPTRRTATAPSCWTPTARRHGGPGGRNDVESIEGLPPGAVDVECTVARHRRAAERRWPDPVPVEVVDAGRASGSAPRSSVRRATRSASPSRPAGRARRHAHARAAPRRAAAPGLASRPTTRCSRWRLPGAGRRAARRRPQRPRRHQRDAGGTGPAAGTSRRCGAASPTACWSPRRRRTCRRRRSSRRRRRRPVAAAAGHRRGALHGRRPRRCRRRW